MLFPRLIKNYSSVELMSRILYIALNSTVFNAIFEAITGAINNIEHYTFTVLYVNV